jgi:uncharacterized protein (TIGR02246 family)
VSGVISAEDRWAIHDLMMQYVLGTDTGDVASYVDSFATDAVLISSDDARLEGHAAIRAHIEKEMSKPRQRGRQHYFQPVKVARAGDMVLVLSYWMVAHRGADAGPLDVRSMGSTDDVCVKVDGEWKIKERRIRRWSGDSAPWLFGAGV